MLSDLWGTSPGPFCDEVQQPSFLVFSFQFRIRVCAVDAMSMVWRKLFAYAFPPFHLIPLVLSKIKKKSKCSIILNAPLWPHRSWLSVFWILVRGFATFQNRDWRFRYLVDFAFFFFGVETATRKVLRLSGSMSIFPSSYKTALLHFALDY